MSLEQPAYSGRVRYTEHAARHYQQRDERKHAAEMALVAKGFGRVPRGRVLDVPCGGGRVSLWLAKNGYTATAADFSESMLEIARQNVRAEGLPVQVHHQDVERMDYGDRSFEAVICFRLFHHFPNEQIRARAVEELCRVARYHVLVSYFSPWAFTSVKRRLQKRFLGRKMAKFATPLGELRQYFEAGGFSLVANFARTPLVHTLNLAVFRRTSGSEVGEAEPVLTSSL